MHENAQLHRAHVMSEYFQTEGITRMDWSFYSFDLNMIEHVGDALQCRISARQIPPRKIQELKSSLLEEWCAIS